MHLGGNLCPPSGDPRWEDWARDLAAFLGPAGRSREDVLRFCLGAGAEPAKAQNLASWLELGGLARGEDGVYRLTPQGSDWLGGHALDPATVVLAELPARRREAPRIKDLRGRSFDRLTVQRLVGVDRWHNAKWECVCSCAGVLCVRRARDLLAQGPSRARSCGCLRREYIAHLQQHRGSAGWRTRSAA
ncbi:MAG TPA: hypothetical protein VGI39_17930 [Polyangiaceae bacterium]|jgi:hypothetical protein